jgi:putative DNA methylase
MTWDFAEANTFADTGGSFAMALDKGAMSIHAFPARVFGSGAQLDAATQEVSIGKVVSTDPPYYDNIGYADLSDFFYVWLRRSLRSVFPDLFATLSVPKSAELVATPYRHGSKSKAEAFFLDGMTEAMHRLVEQSHPAFPVTIYYAFKQSETETTEGTASTGWQTFLGAVIRAGFAISGTWPMRTEGSGRMIAKGANALASSIILVCRHLGESAPVATHREFVAALEAELPSSIRELQRGNIAPVDLAQAAIGPGMAIFTRYSRVVDAHGEALSVRQALALINRSLDKALAEQEGDFDPDSRWALAWFEQYGFTEADFGTADQLSRSKNTSVAGMVAAGIVKAGQGRVRLLRPSELDGAWDPTKDHRRPAWQAVHQLVQASGRGEAALATLITRLGPEADVARELAYRLFVLCERRKWAEEATWYNGLVQSWQEAVRLGAAASGAPVQEQLFADGG